MSKARDIANLVSAGGILADGAIATTEITGVTATSAELNILDGVTATAAELNILDGVTATAAELNYVDGVTSNIQTQIDGLGVTGHGDVGSYVFAGQTATTAVGFGATLSGSALRPAGIDQGSTAWNTSLQTIEGYAQSATLTGTWKCMGAADRSGGCHATLWLRTA
tara:strand:+ start:995 stop:1495 length:501 start_codon:yes stop_codon:yes gene_type:complete